MRMFVPISVGGWARLFSRWDVIAVLLIVGLLVFLGEASRNLFQPLVDLQRTPPSLDPSNLPEYAARTTLRVLGAEFAAIFAIFPSQAWNMAFSFYQSLRTVPTELVEASRSFRLSPWMSFWRVDVPFAMPQLIWNMMMSMSGSWFFVVASEAISVGNTTVTLPGVGSYIALAIQQQNLKAVVWAIFTMLIVILIYDQILFRPLVAWADRFRFDQEPGIVVPQSWVLNILRRSRIVDRLTHPFGAMWRRTLIGRPPDTLATIKPASQPRRGWIIFQWGLIIALTALALWQSISFLIEGLTLSDVG